MQIKNEKTSDYMNSHIPFEYIRAWVTKDSRSSLSSPAGNQLRYVSSAGGWSRQSSFAISLIQTANVFLWLGNIPNRWRLWRWVGETRH